jgi:hypothetical protein
MAGVLICSCARGNAAESFRFDSIRGGQKELAVAAVYGRNHRIPSSAKQTFSFDGAKARYGRFTSPRNEIGVDFAYEHLNGGADCDSLTGTIAYRHYFLVRGRTAMSFDIGLGLTWYDGKFGLVGTKTNFTELAGLTFQRGMGPASALTVEYRFTHTSNAGTATPNLGVNASTIGVGISWYP